jgi:glycosyltransferase involved in cell wall biosynthesis
VARILFVQPSFQPPGGGNGVASWMLQALVAEHDVTVLTWRALDLDEVNHFYGTSIDRSSVRAMQVAAPLRWMVEAVPTPMSLMRSALLTRAARPVASAFDLTVTANNEAEFGRPNVQYVHYPAYLRPRPLVDLRWYHHPGIMLDFYYWLADRLSRTSRARILASRTLVNSNWTGSRFAFLHGGASETLYPPIATEFPDVPWEAREEGFLCIGRIAPEKWVDRVIDIVAAVRRMRPGVLLHLIGSPGERPYYRRVMARVREQDWIRVHEHIGRDDLVRLIATQRYGVHAMVDEHFGMGPAEMVSAGCLVWVHDSGGQVEIVGGDPRFLYTTVDEAVRKILAIMEDPGAQRAAREALAGRGRLFSVERFQGRVREIVREMLRLKSV